MTDTTPIEQFKRDGYLAIESAFNADEVDRMRREADAVLELIINSSAAHRRRSHRAGSRHPRRDWLGCRHQMA